MIESSFGLLEVNAYVAGNLAEKKIKLIEEINQVIDSKTINDTMEKLSEPWFFGLIKRKPATREQAIKYLDAMRLFWHSVKYEDSLARLYKVHILCKAAGINKKEVIYINEWLAKSLYDTEYKHD